MSQLVEHREWWDRTKSPEEHHIEETFDAVHALQCFVHRTRFVEDRGFKPEGFRMLIAWARQQSANLARLADDAEAELKRRFP